MPVRTRAQNVIAGWLGEPIPEMPRQRNKTRAGYRKTGRRCLPPPKGMKVLDANAMPAEQRARYALDRAA